MELVILSFLFALTQKETKRSRRCEVIFSSLTKNRGPMTRGVTAASYAYRPLLLRSVGILFIGGQNGYVARLTGLNNLTSSVTVNSNTSLSPLVIRSIAILEEGEKIVVGGNDSGNGEIHVGEMEYSPSFTINWTQANDETGSPLSVTSQPVNNLIVRESGEGYAVSTTAAPTYTSGKLFVTTDWGYTWTDKTPGSVGGLFAVNNSPSGGIIVTGKEFALIGNVLAYSQRFWYDYLGRIKASQDARQAGYSPDMAYSYIMYDALDRPLEEGQTYADDDPTVSELNDDDNWPVNFKISTAPKIEVTQTYYAEPWDGTVDGYFGTNGQENLRSRVATVAFFDLIPYTGGYDYDHASHYSYDIHGNVKHFIQENKDPLLVLMDQSVKHIEYEYDIITGNVNVVTYQDGEPDQWLHRYQ